MSEPSSGGPKSAGGKAIAKWNAAGHGITSPAPVVPGLEEAKDWTEHRGGVFGSLSPVGTLEENLAERVALMLWRLHRVTRFETTAVAQGVEDVEKTVHERRRFLASMSAERRSVADATHPEDVRFQADHSKASHAALKRFVSSQKGTERRLKSKDASAVIFGAYMTARKLSGKDFEPEDVELPGIPDDHDVYEPPPMTASDVELCVEALSSYAGLEAEEVMTHATENAGFEARSAEHQLEETEREVGKLREERVLADEKTLEKIQKYESHLSRQLYHALHELENLQKRRLTGEGTPLARLDVQGAAEG